MERDFIIHAARSGKAKRRLQLSVSRAMAEMKREQKQLIEHSKYVNLRAKQFDHYTNRVAYLETLAGGSLSDKNQIYSSQSLLRIIESKQLFAKAHASALLVQIAVEQEFHKAKEEHEILSKRFFSLLTRHRVCQDRLAQTDKCVLAMQESLQSTFNEELSAYEA